jgi:hypothetical protein
MSNVFQSNVSGMLPSGPINDLSIGPDGQPSCGRKRHCLPSAFFLLPSSFFLLLSAFCLLARSALPSAFCLLPSSPAGALRVFCLSPTALAATKARLKSGDAALRPAIEKLHRDAEKALKFKSVSVMVKESVPPSGDKHDYMSLAPYFWPDPTKKDGLPYIRKDGERNPESGGANTDAPRFSRMNGAVETLSLAYYFFGKEAYAEHAALLLRAWFLDPATRMNPHLNFGQAIRGVNDGRGTGIIETAKLPTIVDSVGLIAGSPAWTAQDQAGMIDWMRRYLDWLLTSKNGKDEQRAKNNHGTYYDVQVASLALFTGQTDLARSTLEAAKQKRIAVQIEPDGRMPLELARTKSLGYSIMNLAGMEKLASLGERVGVDLWTFQTPDGRGIRKALDYLAPYADPQKQWPHKQITHQDPAALLPLMRQASLHYYDTTYRKEIARLAGDEMAASRMWLLYPEEKP